MSKSMDEFIGRNMDLNRTKNSKAENSKPNGNGKDTQEEHPKPQLEYLEDTAQAVSSFAALKNISQFEATQLLILNELRCMHFHLDRIHGIMIEETDKKGSRR